MNWEAVGAAAELLGAIGVIASLLYLATQIRQSTRTAEDGALRGMVAAINHQLHEMLTPENLAVLLSGFSEYEKLDGSATFRFDSLIAGYLNIIESSINSNQAMLLADDTMENWGYYVRTRFLAYGGTLTWWEEAQGYFSPEMREWMKIQIACTDMDSDIWGIK